MQVLNLAPQYYFITKTKLMKKYIQLKDTWRTKAGDEWIQLREDLTLYLHRGTQTLEKEDILKSHTEWFKEVTEQSQSFRKWRAERGKLYYIVFAFNSKVKIECCQERNDRQDEYNYITGNYFQTKQEAEAYKARQEAIGRVTHDIIEANEGWEPDWEDGNQDKHTIYYDHYITRLNILQGCGLGIPSVLPFCKNKDIALSIISSHKEDLDLIFNVKK